MNIGQASRQSDVSAKMIRHYEAIGLIGAARRSAAGYRTYDEMDVHRLRFIKRARSLGFPIARIKTLLGLWDDKRRTSSKVKELTAEYIADMKRQIAEMQAMVKSLQRLSDSCHGDGREACPILDDLAAGQQLEEPKRQSSRHKHYC